MSLFLSSLFLLTVTLVSYILLIGGPHARRRLEEERQRIEEEQKRKRKEVDGDKVDQAIEFDLLTTTVPIDDANVKTDSFFTQTGLAEVLTIRTPTVTGSIVDDDETRPLFIVIPGNPGLVKFYRVFIANLDRLCQGKVEVSQSPTPDRPRPRQLLPLADLSHVCTCMCHLYLFALLSLSSLVSLCLVRRSYLRFDQRRSQLHVSISIRIF